MATGSSNGGRSRHGARSTRSHRSSGSGRSSRRRDEGEAEVVRPDVDELRRKRYDYFGRPVEERRKIVSPAAKPSSKGGSLARTVTVEYKSKKKSSSSRSSRESSSRKEPRKERDRTAEYVYGGAPPVEVVVERGSGDEYEREPSVRSSRSKRSSPSHTDDLPSILEQEVTPDDSISQVAERMYSRPRRSARERTSSKRESMPAIAEQPDRVGTAPSPRKSQKRESLLDTLFRRKSAHEPAKVKLVECLACGSDDIPSTRSAKLECGHRMCHSCLRRVFRMAVTDPAHMPPRCCNPTQHIPLSHVEGLFDLKFKVQFNKKFDEYHTKNRIYCPNPRCGTWIRPSNFHTSNGRKYASCPKCKTKACTLCSGKMHKSADCPKDPEIARLIAQAEQEGWKRCYKCNAMVELKEGCNHMTCRCMAEFCMVCGSKWKTCDCPWFNHRDLPDPDRLNDMRVPEPIQVIYRRVFDAAAPRPPQQPGMPPPLPREPLLRRGDRLQIRTYAEEIDHRRRQERLDEDLARRMQWQSLMDPLEEVGAGRRHRAAQGEVFGNAGEHFMNDDFRQSGSGPGSMRNFGDEAMGRRGERVSGRKRSVREAPTGNGGLVGDFLGSPSVLGMGPAGGRRPGRLRG